jgi:uncharacterized membrane protein
MTSSDILFQVQVKLLSNMTFLLVVSAVCCLVLTTYAQPQDSTTGNYALYYTLICSVFVYMHASDTPIARPKVAILFWI